MESGYLDLVDTIKTLNQQALKKWDQTALCEIVTKNNDGTYNIRMLSDEGENGSIIPNVRNGSKYSFKEGDQGVLFKYKNQITMSFLVFKIGGEEETPTTPSPKAVKYNGLDLSGENEDGLSIVMASNSEIDAKSQKYHPIVPFNLDYAVKSGLVNNALTLTDEEKASAQSWLGVSMEDIKSYVDEAILGGAW